MELDDVSRNYDRAATHYDFWTNLVFHQLLGLYRYRRRLIGRLGNVEGATVLDVGCGTGNNWPLLVPRIGAAGYVIGVDYSPGMLKQARQRANAADWFNVRLIRDDAAELRQVQGPVDTIVSAWCLGIVHDLPAALRRIVELTRPGGRIAILDFAQSRPDGGILRLFFPIYRRILIAAGVDTPDDIDDDQLRSRWREGRAILHELLPDLVEERFLRGAGMLLHGTRPLIDL